MTTRQRESSHILIVDDEPRLRDTCARILERAGYKTYQAEDGAAALNLVRASEGMLDLVISDIVMPNMNGVELLKTLAISEPDLPVLLMSAYSPEALRARGIEASCAVLTKPFSADLLLAEVRRCLKTAA